MPFFHISVSDAEEFQDDYNNAIRNGTLVMIRGINWSSGQVWVESALKTAGFDSGIIYWPTSGHPMLAVDFNDNGTATRAVGAFQRTDVDGYVMNARFHQETPSKYTQPAKAGDSQPSMGNFIRDAQTKVVALAPTAPPLKPIEMGDVSQNLGADAVEAKAEPTSMIPSVSETYLVKHGHSFAVPHFNTCKVAKVSEPADVDSPMGTLGKRKRSNILLDDAKNYSLARSQGTRLGAGTEGQTRAQRQAIRFVQRSQPPLELSYPKSWEYDDEGAHLINYMRDREAEEARRSGGCISKFNKEGPTTEFYACQYSPEGAASGDKSTVAFTKRSDSRLSTLIKYAYLGSKEEAMARAEGYTPFVVGALPFKYRDRLKDPRRCERPMDILSHNTPHEDTARFFPRPVEIFSRLFKGQPWRPELPIIPAKGWMPTADQAEACLSFYNPKNEGDPKFLNNRDAAKRKLIVTSRSFLVKQPRGALNGVGWGEFDKFTEWQFQGRKVELEMLDKNLVFDRTSSRPLYFVSAPGEKQRAPFVVDTNLNGPDEEQDPNSTTQTTTLQELLLSKKTRTQNRGQIYGRGRVRGGDRGGRGRGRGGRGGQVVG